MLKNQFNAFMKQHPKVLSFSTKVSLKIIAKQYCLLPFFVLLGRVQVL